MSLARSRKHLPEPKVEINVVPLVDVSLVLLIIFMVTATFIKTAGMHLQLPTSSLTQNGGAAKHDIVIGVGPDGALLWQGNPLQDGQLASVLQQEAKAHGVETRVTIQGDRRAMHGRVVQAMTIAQQVGFSHLVIATKQESK
ncbi:MAG: ExbD/TolR family protein [Armatimonadota bacterium]